MTRIRTHEHQGSTVSSLETEGTWRKRLQIADQLEVQKTLKTSQSLKQDLKTESAWGRRLRIADQFEMKLTLKLNVKYKEFEIEIERKIQRS